MKALRIDVDGTREMVEITGETIEQQNDCIYAILGGHFDLIRLSWNAVMLVDDEGLLKELEINVAAMMLSGYPMIAGTALIFGVQMTDDGEIFTDCPERFERLA